MAQYMILSYGPAEAPADMELSPEMIQAIIQKYNAFTERLQKAGLTGINKLIDGTGRVLRGSGDKLVVTDGPFAESKEVIGGYWIVEARSYDDAVALARHCPSLEFGGTVEVREVEDLSALMG
ncbi:MAG TPA: YciI family protein [Blastocatellia bacterium]|nr:YciI family protein [Blastocatellia bacterium]